MNALSPAQSLSPFGNRLQGLTEPARRAAATELLRVGLPGRHIEAWHYTGLLPLAGQEFGEVPDGQDAAAEPLLKQVLNADERLTALPRVVLVNGRISKALSTAMPDGVIFTSFASAPDFADGASPERDPMVALNTALAVDGMSLKVGSGVQGGVVLLISLSVGCNTAASFHPRHHVVLAEGSSLTLVEVATGADGQAVCLNNPVLTAHVAEHARLEHIRLQQEAAEAISLSTVCADVAAHGVYDSFTLGLGAQLSRYEVHSRLGGVHSEVHVNGAQLLGDRQVGDITSVTTHAAPEGISRQVVRNVLTDRARAVFQGKVLVEQVAQKTDGSQMNQALLLSEGAEIDAKPELEIYADDVKCSHGATVGALDDDQIFYMRARGISDAQARQMLVEAFLTEATGLVQNEVARSLLDHALSAALSRRIRSQETAA